MSIVTGMWSLQAHNEDIPNLFVIQNCWQYNIFPPRFYPTPVDSEGSPRFVNYIPWSVFALYGLVFVVQEMTEQSCYGCFKSFGRTSNGAERYQCPRSKSLQNQSYFKTVNGFTLCVCSTILTTLNRDEALTHKDPRTAFVLLDNEVGKGQVFQILWRLTTMKITWANRQWLPGAISTTYGHNKATE